MLPEMAFCGYVFTDLEDIRPFLEPKNNSPTIQWCCEVAQKFQCWVTAGFALLDIDDLPYNAMCVVNREGKLFHIYRKHFLYYDDERWANPGPSFSAINIPEFGTTGFGICMDLNPYKFESDYYLFEFANFHLTKKSKLVLCAMAWIEDPSEEISDPTAYWIDRLRPLNRSGCCVLIANRLGKEGESVFCGRSSVIQFCESGTKLAHCGKDEDLFVVRIALE